jgi:RNA polymerase primary sigma factor
MQPTEVEGLTLYVVRDLSEELKLTLQTVRNYIKQGKLNGRKIGGRWYVLSITNKTTHIPAETIEKRVVKCKNKPQKLSVKLKRPPSHAKVAKEADITALKTVLIGRAMKPTGSLVSGITSGDVVGTHNGQTTNQRTQLTDEEVFEAYEKETISKLLKGVGKREATILRMRFGLDDGDSMTLQQIGEKLNISRERVRQIEKEALRKLSYNSGTLS